MPIVGPPRTDSTQTLGCTSSVSTLPKRDESRWWHSTVFVTSLSMSSYSSQGVPDLTTVYTYPTQCVDRWMGVILNCNNASVPQNTTVYSIDPARIDMVSDPLYRSCQRYSTPVYSPGVCPSGHTIAEVTAFVSEVTTGVDRTFWQASCCRRFHYPHNTRISKIRRTDKTWAVV
jgi:hypothetical protein